MPLFGKKPSYRLTFNDAVKVWKLYWQGEYQNRIAASFDVNSARINEAIKGDKHRGSEQVAKGIHH